MEWRNIETMPMNTWVFVKTVSGLIREAHTKREVYSTGTRECRGANGALYRAVKWKPLQERPPTKPKQLF